MHEKPLPESVHVVRGEQVRMPVEVRAATGITAQFLLPAGPARETLAAAGLEPVTPLPGRIPATLGFMHYLDGDLGVYHEFLVALMCRQPGVRGSTGVFIHWLPVDELFTCEAGQTIWGFPKEIAAIDVTTRDRRTRCEVRLNDRAVVAMEFARGVPAPSAMGAMTLDAYTHRDGALRRTPWTMRAGGTRMRPGGARIELGDHPISDDLRRLGLPRKALFTNHIGELTMRFDDATPISSRS
ncbi:acetoacetate decarboxylase family protein [Saccharopolyspora sp. TS4A08]|uniref:Acetoacetate decarboxylase family protein n=1 Tax=Saccharopolyspora ipomoeae TaxID=3042027 RepID=A0ABT6PMX3_9PSEU|nr:acetoacetate decarboxylase family protein [Saccharopolyspora sp. TS4A08]MDI2029365.1 acetoacetate decarboxylase family protein [Saccharopolyspora sp. TS4A08]